MRRSVALLSFVVLGLALLAPGAAAQDGVLDIPIDTVVREVEGSVTVLASVDVPAEAVGLTCTGNAVTSNQGSVHPNNDLLVETGGATFVFENVEDAPGQTIPASGSFVLGETFTVSLRMGPDEVFSGGIRIEVDCTQAETTTTTPETTTTTSPEVIETTEPAEEVTTTTSASQTEADDDELPNTGFGTGTLLMVGAALVASGLVFVTWERRQAGSQS